MKKFRIEALILALGIVVLGLCINHGLSLVGKQDRVVSVRGLAEREVMADRVIWPVVYNTVGDNLTQLYDNLNRANARIKSYLRQNGISDKEMSTGAPQVVDLWADRYNTNRPVNRYNLTSTITVTTSKVDKVRQLISNSGELLKEGLAISTGDYNSRVQYEFTSLNKIKPRMIEEATRNAREAGEKFAKDSESKLGKIKNASQGLFTITDRDSYTPYIKNVRVVTMVDYYLDN